MELNKIYRGDCLEVMSQFPDECIDVVVTSPPYNFGGFSRNGRERHYDTYSDDMPENDYHNWIERVMLSLSRVLKRGGAIYWNHKGRFIDGVYYPPFWIIDKCPLSLYQHIVWKYPSSPDVAKVKWYPRHEEIFMFSKGKPAFFNEEMSSFGDVWEISHVQKNDHPAPFPFKLASRCIKASCPPNGIVYDPFMGSGTTALAALDLGMNFVGSEISEKYCQYAEERIGIKASEPKLF